MRSPISWGCSAGSILDSTTMFSVHTYAAYMYIYIVHVIHLCWISFIECMHIYIYCMYSYINIDIYQRKNSKRCHKTKHIARYATVLPCLHQSSISPSSNAQWQWLTYRWGTDLPTSTPSKILPPTKTYSWLENVPWFCERNCFASFFEVNLDQRFFVDPVIIGAFKWPFKDSKHTILWRCNFVLGASATVNAWPFTMDSWTFFPDLILHENGKKQKSPSLNGSCCKFLKASSLPFFCWSKTSIPWGSSSWAVETKPTSDSPVKFWLVHDGRSICWLTKSSRTTAG